MLHQPLYIASYNQSKFGKLKTMTVPEIVSNAIHEACGEIEADPTLMDVGSIGSACGFTLNDQGLLSGLMAMVSGLGGKPMEAVENACATGGQAILSVAHKLLLGLGDVGIAVGRVDLPLRPRDAPTPACARSPLSVPTGATSSPHNLRAPAPPRGTC